MPVPFCRTSASSVVSLSSAGRHRAWVLYREFDFDQEHMARVLCRLGDLALEQGNHVLAGDRHAESLKP